MFVRLALQTPSLLNGKMKAEENQNYAESAHLILDEPLVAERIDVQVAAGQRYIVVLKRYITKPGLAYIVLADGVVVDQNETIPPGTEIRCVPQIIGG